MRRTEAAARRGLVPESGAARVLLQRRFGAGFVELAEVVLRREIALARRDQIQSQRGDRLALNADAHGVHPREQALRARPPGLRRGREIAHRAAEIAFAPLLQAGAADRFLRRGMTARGGTLHEPRRARRIPGEQAQGGVIGRRGISTLRGLPEILAGARLVPRHEQAARKEQARGEARRGQARRRLPLERGQRAGGARPDPLFDVARPPRVAPRERRVELGGVAHRQRRLPVARHRCRALRAGDAGSRRQKNCGEPNPHAKAARVRARFPRVSSRAPCRSVPRTPRARWRPFPP